MDKKDFNIIKSLLSSDIFLKSIILIIIILLPIIVALKFSKTHTYIEQDQKLLPIIANKLKQKYTLLYVGYTGCINICTPRLQEISTIQRVLKDKGDTIGYMFLDLRTLGDDVSGDFLKAFYGDFEVLSLKKDDKSKLLKQLQFYFTKSLYDTNEFEHSSYLYLLEKEKDQVQLIATIMQYPFTNKETIEFLHKRVNYENR